MSIWDNYAVEELRDSRRKRFGRVAFDCFNLKVEDDRVHCTKGHHLGQAEDGTLALTLVLKGITPRVCRECQDFDGEEIVDPYQEHLDTGVTPGGME